MFHLLILINSSLISSSSSSLGYWGESKTTWWSGVADEDSNRWPSFVKTELCISIVLLLHYTRQCISIINETVCFIREMSRVICKVSCFWITLDYGRVKMFSYSRLVCSCARVPSYFSRALLQRVARVTNLVFEM